MGAVELSAAKAALPGYGGTTDDAQLAVELAAAEAQVAALCGWPVDDDGAQSFETATYTLYPTPSRTTPRLLPLPFATASVTSVHVTDSDTYDSGSLVDATDYTATDDGLWSIGAGWTRTTRGNRVICTAGWAAGEAPAAVQAAVIAQLVHRWRVLRSGQGIAQASQQGSSLSRDLAAIPLTVQHMAQLSPAYRWSVAVG